MGQVVTKIGSFAQIHTRYKISGTRIYEPTILLEFNVLGINKVSWLGRILHALDTVSSNTRFSHQDAGAFKSALEACAKESNDIFNLSRLPTRQELGTIFSRLEIHLEKTDVAESLKARRSSVFRSYIWRGLSYLPGGDDIQQAEVPFKTRFRAKSKPRQMISSLSTSVKIPIEANHPEHVRAYGKDIVRNDISVILDACVYELKYWESVRKTIAEAGSVSPTPKEVKTGRVILSSSKNVPPTERKKLQEFPLQQLLKIYSAVIIKEGLANVKRPFSPLFWRSKEILNYLVEERFAEGSNPVQVLFLPYRASTNEIIAAFLVLLIHTGWNSDSLLNLNSRGVRKERRGFIIQGYKPKTDDDTPEVYLDQTKDGAIQALKLLMWNQEQLKQYGFIDKNDTGLWYSWSIKNDEPYKHHFVGYRSALTKFLKRHSLPSFSFDMVRAQVNAIRYFDGEAIDAIRQGAGHRSLRTTGHYLQQFLVAALANSANSEFQRQLEKNVKFRIDASSNKSTLNENSQDLLSPIGDGTSCISPNNPPNETYLSGAMCEGTRCHEGKEGCKNNRVVIDRNRLEELVRMRRYFLNNCIRLMDENRERFVRVLAPSILYTFALYDYVKSGQYSDVLREIEKNTGLRHV